MDHSYMQQSRSVLLMVVNCASRGSFIAVGLTSWHNMAGTVSQGPSGPVTHAGITSLLYHAQVFVCMSSSIGVQASSSLTEQSPWPSLYPVMASQILCFGDFI